MWVEPPVVSTIQWVADVRRLCQKPETRCIKTCCRVIPPDSSNGVCSTHLYGESVRQGEAVPEVDYIRINHCNKKILIYKHRVAAGFTSAVYRRETSPRSTRVKMVAF